MMLYRLGLIAVVLLCMGCSAAPEPLKRLSIPLIGNPKEQSLPQTGRGRFVPHRQTGRAVRVIDTAGSGGHTDETKVEHVKLIRETER